MGRLSFGSSEGAERVSALCSLRLRWKSVEF